jgi:YggT family protein
MHAAPTVPPTQPVQSDALMESSPLAQGVDPLQPQWRYRVDARTEPRRSGLATTYRVVQTVYLLVGIVEALIITRVALKLLAANSGVGFVRFVYGVSGPLVAPFSGIFPTPVSNTNVLELSSLLAIAIYGLITWANVRMFAILGRRPLPRTAG